MTAPPRRRRRRPRRPSPPPIIDPILALWERFDRWRRQIRPLRPEGVLGLEVGRHRGSTVRLADGTVVSPGDPIGIVHLQNTRVRELVERISVPAGVREGRLDMRALAAWAREQPAGKRPVAYHAATILWPLARRAGFEVRPRKRTAWTRLEDWHFRGLMVRWSPLGRRRLAMGRGTLRSSDVWLSDAALQRLFGTPTPVPARPPTRVGGDR